MKQITLTLRVLSDAAKLTDLASCKLKSKYFSREPMRPGPIGLNQYHNTKFHFLRTESASHVHTVSLISNVTIPHISRSSKWPFSNPFPDQYSVYVFISSS
jgi:hypothetical protein